MNTPRVPRERVGDKLTIVPEALYTVPEVASILGFSRAKSVYDVPERELPRTYVGPRRGALRIRGSDLLSYIDAGRRVA